jgi:voltage-gated sodium channel
MPKTKNTYAWQRKIEAFLAQPFIQHFIVFLILLNAGILGLETNPEIVAAIGHELALVDHAILVVFILELALLMLARSWRFFLDPWCVFDFAVIAIALIPATESFSVLRSLRVLRVLRLINKVESMKKVVAGLLSSLPSLASVAGLTMIVFYLYGKEFPELFGSMGDSAFTLFQVMTLESWSEGVARPIMEKIPNAWIFFLIFIFIATFIVINLFIAVIVDSLNNLEDDPRDPHHHIEATHKELGELRATIASMQTQMQAMTSLLEDIKRK